MKTNYIKNFLFVFTLLSFTIFNIASGPVEVESLQEAKEYEDEYHEDVCECYEEAKENGGDVYQAMKDCDTKYYKEVKRDKLSSSDQRSYINYSDRLYDERQKIKDKYMPEFKPAKCRVCGRNSGTSNIGIDTDGKCLPCYQKSKGVDVTKP